MSVNRIEDKDSCRDSCGQSFPCPFKPPLVFRNVPKRDIRICPGIYHELEKFAILRRTREGDGNFTLLANLTTS